MTKLTSKIATAIAILGLAGPALAASGTPSSTGSSAGQPSAQITKHKHKKVAQADEKAQAGEKKATVKKAQKKHKAHAASTAKGDKAAESAPAPAAPAPATPAPATK